MLGERLVESADYLTPVAFAFGDEVELLLHFGGEFDVQDLGEIFFEHLGHQGPDLGGTKTTLVLLHVIPLLDDVDYRRVGGRPSDAVLLERPDEARLVVARRGFREMLGGDDPLELEFLALRERRQFPLLEFHGPDLQKAVEFKEQAVGLESVALARRNVRADGIEFRFRQLGGQESPPNEIVELAMAGFELIARKFICGSIGMGGADGLVRFLRQPRFSLEYARRSRGVLLAQIPAYPISGRIQGFPRKVHGIRAHIGDMSVLVELLGEIHRLLRGIAESLGRGLLQGAGGERRQGVLLDLLALQGLDAKSGRGKVALDLLGALLAPDAQFLQVLVPDPIQLRAELALRAQEVCLDGPIFLGLESQDLLLAVHDEPQGHGLDAPRGKSPHDLLPQEGRKLVAHQTVQYPPGLLGVHQVPVDLPGGREGFRYRALGDLVEDDAVRARDVQSLRQMPGNGLAFAVFVGREDDPVRLGRQLLELRHSLLILAGDHVLRLKTVLHVDTQLAFGQVADMAVG